MRRKRMRGLSTVAVPSALLVAAAGCGGNDVLVDEPAAATENIEGVITRIQHLDQPFPRVLIEENPTTGAIAPETDGKKIRFTITPSTVLEREVEGGSTVAIGAEDLEVGSRARGWPTSPITDSYPQHAGAARILVLLED